MAADLPQFKLHNGVLMPSVGMGCWMGEPGGAQRVYDMVTNALKAGYRHFDTADGYHNEEEVGRAIRDSGVPRKEIFVTTKLNNDDHGRVKEAFQESLAALDIEYIDLYLMHWPIAQQGSGFGTSNVKVLQPDESPTIHETWAEMIKLQETGKVRALGVSNFGVPLLESLLAKNDKLIPTVNQIELHPFFPRKALHEYCAKKGIVITAYSPLGQPQAGSVSPLLTDEVVTSIAKKAGASAGQVLLSWSVQQGIVVVPKSENPERMKTNLQLIKLDEADMKALGEVHEQPGKHRSLLNYHNKEGGVILGYTYEQLGWEELTVGGVAK